MKNDMRITYPLWQVGVVVILMALVLLSGFSSNPLRTGVFYVEGKIGVLRVVIMLIFIICFLLFYWRIVQHNKRMPKHKIEFFSWKPQEYMDDDELFQEVTKRATKKVYTYFVCSIPILAGLSIMYQLGTVWMVLGLLILSIGQYVIYYTEIRKYVGEVE